MLDMERLDLKAGTTKNCALEYTACDQGVEVSMPLRNTSVEMANVRPKQRTDNRNAQFTEVYGLNQKACFPTSNPGMPTTITGVVT